MNLANKLCKITFSKFSLKSFLAKPLSDHLSDLTTHSWQLCFYWNAKGKFALLEVFNLTFESLHRKPQAFHSEKANVVWIINHLVRWSKNKVKFFTIQKNHCVSKLDLNIVFHNFGFLTESQIREYSTQCLPNAHQIPCGVKSPKSQCFTYLCDMSSVALRRPFMCHSSSAKC